MVHVGNEQDLGAQLVGRSEHRVSDLRQDLRELMRKKNMLMNMVGEGAVFGKTGQAAPVSLEVHLRSRTRRRRPRHCTPLGSGFP